LEDGDNVIDLDLRTGQNTKYGTSSVSQADGLLNVTNNTSGAMTVALQKFLNFGGGVYSKTFTTQQLTVDVYGRVVGFSDQDQFYFSEYTYISTAGQTNFTIDNVGGSTLVFCNGCALNVADYTESPTAITLNSAPQAGSIVYIMEMRAVASSNYNSALNITATVRVSNNVFTYAQPPIQIITAGMNIAFTSDATAGYYTVTAIDYATKQITVSTNLPAEIDLVGKAVYLHRQASESYPAFGRVSVDVASITSLTPTEFYVRNGFEQVYVNGVQFNEIDYDLKNNTFSGFPSPVTGNVELTVFSANNLNIPCSNITNSVTYSVSGQAVYPFTANPLAMEVYANGISLVEGTSYDYIADTIAYTMLIPFTNNNTLLNQQTFARDGAA